MKTVVGILAFWRRTISCCIALDCVFPSGDDSILYADDRQHFGFLMLTTRSSCRTALDCSGRRHQPISQVIYIINY